MVNLKNRKHLIKVLKSLIDIDDIDIIKYSLASLVDVLEENISDEFYEDLDYEYEDK